MATAPKRKATLLDFFGSPAHKKSNKTSVTTEKDKNNNNKSNESDTSAKDTADQSTLTSELTNDPTPTQSSSTSSNLSKSTSEPENSGEKLNKTSEKRSFHKNWLIDYTWLSYNENDNAMTCTLCVKHKKSNALTTGKCNNFKTSTLSRHAESSDHKAAATAKSMTGTLEKSVEKVYDEKEKAVVKALKSISSAIRKSVLESIDRSPFVSILCDESTDIGVKKKLSVYARVVNPETFQAATLYICNKEIDSGTGKGIYDALNNAEEVKGIPREKIMGLGSYGAKVMTGMGQGLTGYITRDNPMMLNYHCIAHRLALVTSQAADEVQFLVDYQRILTGIFYFFKSSAKRTHELNEIQNVLSQPNLKVKEVHEVRWMSVFIAVETVYKILDSLITFFAQDKDAKSKGYAKKMVQYDFIATTYMLMDVLPIVTELCLLFQKADLDVSLVKVSVDTCKKELSHIKNGTQGKSPHLQKLVNEDLKTDKGKVVFKANHIVQGKQNIDSIKVKFIDSILSKLDQRFPENDSNIMYAFAVLSMRPISFCSKEDLETWGNEKLEILIKQYGEKKESKPTEYQPIVTVEPIIIPDETRKEWDQLKPLVLQEGYPRDKMSTLWRLIQQNYKDRFPNLIKLAALALTAPIHTSDCERGFSSQNQVKTSLRNRIGSETVDNLLMIKIQGGKLEEFDFSVPLKLWREKQRKLFSSYRKE
ncbi:zinc finger protein 862-like [Mercenaria mercenaria]|uniref:zinc finger protein 862-like n=1 Tax=Mercenaria mercenaria TaxID=6596 RepID=UPI00234F5E11|nr:zinc finger protein 862-like [Mercenaria mercenaria]